ncbi:pseudouridine kinase [Chromobacterium alkanivorans]|uniref:PfkB family carbohydrate kinase n=1 Tax=Chromobacterium alkanivorans TaxID=1071719 RepID=UPI0021693CC5|nr:PfkB family carbohydrate kinase [Chromobacterium alkanivorans]MCS3805873.1 pseudouridine kinase [Chromobacterium alkanivorans]MCS3820211.1 pseudouridine kinase [Chromobacterium alkanivorans]MCS3874969.1 pseudouridine kinase [Chromobacterium alkanivorans]
MTEREQQILALLRRDPLIPQQELADQLGISRSAVAGHIMNLAQKGHIRGKGYILAEQRYVAAVGGANMDIVGSASAALRHGDSNPGQVRCSPGGVARNVAENLARLGADCRLVSVVGDDIHGRSLLEATQRAGVDVRGCLTLPDAATSTYLSIQQADGDMALAINDMDILNRLTPERLQAQRDLVRHAGAVVADTNLSADALAWLIAETGDKPLFVDPVSAFKAERVRPWLSRIHTLKPNRLEAAALSGLPLERAEHAPEAARWFHEQGVRRVVLSMAGAGIYYSGEAGDGWLDAPDCAIVNTTGSGDALMAGLAWGWLNELSLADSVRFARGCAALTLSSAATNNPSLSRAAVEAYLNA